MHVMVKQEISLLLVLLLSLMATNTMQTNVTNAAGSQPSICRSSPHQMECTYNSAKFCDTFAVFYAKPSYQSLGNVSKLFNADMNRVASASSIPPRADMMLVEGQEMIIPLRCECTEYHYEVSLRYEEVDQNTFTAMTRALEDLYACTYQQEGPGNSWNAKIFLKCGCPTMEQSSQGFKYLLTYPLRKGESLDKIADSYYTPKNDILKANGIKDLGTASSILIPLRNDPVVKQQQQPGNRAPSFRPNPSPGAANPRTNNTNPDFPRPVYGAPGNNQTNQRDNRLKEKKKKEGSNLGRVIGIVVGAVVATMVVVMAVAGTIFMLKRRKKEDSKETSDIESNKPSAPRSEDGNSSGAPPRTLKKSRSPNEAPVITFTLDQLIKATESFSPACRIGGSVYHGLLNGMPAAIKQTRAGMSGEFKCLQTIHHSNLIKLIGICNDNMGEQCYLIFEFAENGSLSDWLHGGLALKNRFISSCSRFLSWEQRLQICLDVAEGLQYIHSDIPTVYVHKNIRSSNVLLNSEFRAKIANFCMPKSKEISIQELEAGEYHNPDGAGYMAPEYLTKGLLTRKTDSYSFGVLLLEVLSGKPPLISKSRGGFLSLSIPEEEELKQWMDPRLNEEYSPDQALSLLRLAESCVQEEASQRPAMDEIVISFKKLLDSSTYS